MPALKVWRPKGFEGLELVQVVEDRQPFEKAYLEDYYLAVGQRGPAEVLYRGERHRLSDNVFQVYQPGEVLAATPTERGCWSYLALRASPKVVSTLAATSHLAPFATSQYQNQALCNALVGVFESFCEPNTRLERGVKLTAALQLVLSYQSAAPPEKRSRAVEKSAVTTVQDYLHAHATDEVSLDTLAELVGLSKYYLLRMFTQTLRISPHGYQMSLRIYRAKALLRAGREIAAVAVETGFADQAHLTRKFKSFVGVTPGQYQKACAG